MFILAITDILPFAITVIVIIVGYKMFFKPKEEVKVVPIKKETPSDEFEEVVGTVDDLENGE